MALFNFRSSIVSYYLFQDREILQDMMLKQHTRTFSSSAGQFIPITEYGTEYERCWRNKQTLRIDDYKSPLVFTCDTLIIESTLEAFGR